MVKLVFCVITPIHWEECFVLVWLGGGSGGGEWGESDVSPPWAISEEFEEIKWSKA